MCDTWVGTVSGLVDCAWLRDWDKLIDDSEPYLFSTEDRFLKVAVSNLGRPAASW